MAKPGVGPSVTLAVRGRTERRLPLGQRIVKALPLYALLIPSVSGLIIFYYYPALIAIYRSLFEWDIGLPPRWVGLNNFVVMLTQDSAFLFSMRNIAILTAWTSFSHTVIPLIVAELLLAVKSSRLKYWLRMGLVLPVVIPSMVTLLLWRFIYDGSFGLLNALLKAVGLASCIRVWLGNPETAIWAITFAGFPWVNGINTLIVLAGLQAINPEAMEASQIDGATTLRRICYVDIPLVMGQIRLNLVRAIISGIQTFEIIFVLTEGGPVKSTMVPGLWMYRKAFQYHQMGYASAIGVFLFMIILLLTIANMRILRETSL